MLLSLKDGCFDPKIDLDLSLTLRTCTGGHFVGTCPDGKQVMSAIGGKGEAFKSPALILRKLWRGNPACFGSSFKCAIHDTVTQGRPAPCCLMFMAFSDM